jgi:hypothetical protein
MKANSIRSTFIGAIGSFLLVPVLIGSAGLMPSSAVATTPCYETDYWGDTFPCVLGITVVRTNFTGVANIHAGVPFELYVVGGSALQGPTGFLIEYAATKQTLCSMDPSSYPTPVWHCTVTFSAPGTFLVAATYNGYRAYAHLPTAVNITVLP